MMADYPLQRIENNAVIRYFLRRPDFLSEKDEMKLIALVKSGNTDGFYECAAKLISSSGEIANLLIYIMDKLESQGFSSKELKDNVCWRLFSAASVGWLELYDPEILSYCRKNVADENLIAELRCVKTVRWFDSYFSHVHLERQIMYNTGDLEKNIDRYIIFIQKLLKEKRINKERYDKLLKQILEHVFIYKGKQMVGALISEKLQKRLGCSMIVPKVSIIVDSSEKLK